MKLNPKDIQSFSNDLKKLNESIDNITDNVDDINNQFEGYSDEISAIKDNVRTLENELKNFISDVKVSPIISEAKQQIEACEIELDKKYHKYNVVRDKYLEIINGIKDNEIDKSLILSGDGLMSINIPNYYLSYVLMAVISWINNNKKQCNKYIKQALDIDKEKTAIALLTLYTRINKTDIALKWLKYYLDTIDPKSTNKYFVKVLQLIQNDDKLINELKSWLKKYSQDLDEDDYNKVMEEWISFLGLNKNYINDSYNFILEYCDSEKILNELNDSYAYSNAYTKILSLLKDTDYDVCKDLVYIPEENEKVLLDNISKNKLIIKNNGKKTEKKTKNDNVFIIMLNSLYSKKYNKRTKELILSISKKYILNLLGDIKTNELIIQIGNWKGSTKDGSNEKQLLNEITNYVKEPFDKDIEDARYINYKTIYSIVFVLIGIAVLIFSTTLGVTMILVGAGMTVYFLNYTTSMKNDYRKLYEETLDTYIIELNNTLAEIVDVNIVINRNSSNRDKLINYIKNIGGKNED